MRTTNNKVIKKIFGFTCGVLFTFSLASCGSTTEKEAVYATSVASLDNNRVANFYLYDDYTKYFKEDIKKQDINVYKLDNEKDSYLTVSDFTFSFYDDYTLEIKLTVQTSEYEPDYLIKIDEDATLISKPIYGIYNANNFYLYHQGVKEDTGVKEFLCSVATPTHLPIPSTTYTNTTTETVKIEKRTDAELKEEGCEIGRSEKVNYNDFADITTISNYEVVKDTSGTIILERLISRKWKIEPYHLDEDGKSLQLSYTVYSVKVNSLGERSYYWPRAFNPAMEGKYISAVYVPMETEEEQNEQWTVEIVLHDSKRDEDIRSKVVSL